MKAGLSGHIWSLEEVVGLFETKATEAVAWRGNSLALCAFVVGLTVVNHFKWTPILVCPLYPGLMVHILITGGTAEL
jgi:hypothetical protein